VSTTALTRIDTRPGRACGQTDQEAEFAQCSLMTTSFVDYNLSLNFRTARNYSIDVRANVLKSARISLPEAASLLTGLGLVLD